MDLIFEWPRAEYRITQADPSKAVATPLLECSQSRPSLRLESVSQPAPYTVTAKHLGLSVELLTRLGSSPGSDDPPEQTVLKVASVLGMLRGNSRAGSTEDIGVWLHMSQRLREIYSAGQWRKPNDGFPTDMGSTTHLADIEVHIVPSQAGMPKFVLRPRSLWEAMEVYAAHKVAAGADLARCIQCDTPFLRGGGRGAGYKKAGALFCSDLCKSAHHNALNRK